METQQKYRRLQTSTRILWVKENEDGSLFITDDFEKSIWNAGLLINQLGGIDKVKNRLQGEELTKEEAKTYIQERRAYIAEMRITKKIKYLKIELHQVTLYTMNY